MSRILILLALAALAVALDNGLASTPPMGFNTWNKFACNINDTILRETAKIMASNGMKEAGYVYLNIDDCWQGGRDANGEIVPKKDRFPYGIKNLADYVHSLGLKLGIYTDVSKWTCQRYDGSSGHEAQDAKTYAKWGIDYVKVDWCFADPLVSAKVQYSKFRDAFNASGRPVVFSICNWGQQKPWEWGMEVGNLWRTTGDISNNWDSVVSIMHQQVGLAKFSGVGGWNDPDMLEVGNGGLNEEESKTHFIQWSMLAAPLIAGNDLRQMSQTTRDILLAPEIIDIDQDPLGKQADRVAVNGKLEVWARPLSNRNFAVSCVNLDSVPRNITINFKDVGLADDQPAWMRDVWNRVELGVFSTSFTCANVPPHGTQVYKITHRC